MPAEKKKFHKYNVFGIIDGKLANRKVKATSKQNAEKQVLKLYPHATIHATTEL